MTHSPIDIDRLAADVEESGKNLGEPYLRFPLNDRTAGVLSVASAKEVFAIAAENIVPVPNAAPCLLGICNHRNRAYWVVDLLQLLGMGMLEVRLHHYAVILLQSEQTALLLALPQVEGMTRIRAEQIQAVPSSCPPHLAPFTAGCISSGSDHTYLLDAQAIAAAPALQN